MEVVLNDFVIACREGNLELARELTKTHNLTAKNAIQNVKKAFLNACSNGNVLTTQWLVGTFDLTAGNTRSENNYALRRACYYGHISTAQWLLDNLLTVEDALEVSKDNYLLSLEMKKWLINYQPIGIFAKPAKM